MIYRVLQIFLSFVTIFYCVYCDNNVSRKTEQRRQNFAANAVGGGTTTGVVGIGLQICLNSVKIHKNKIIRTEDSREMGAKYINEIDLDSRNECLRLCCETEQCDVFVYEEKIPGSCYLFHCGSLDDFKCKFTNHANYTSAVIIKNLNTQTNAELEEQIRRTQQDHELESLRKLADNNLPQEYLPRESVTSPPVVTEASKIVLATTTTLPAKPACTRNQFECRTSGDCIAIYNACDGIPQCADGSDEASELGCPTDKPSVAPAVVRSKEHEENQQQVLTSQIGSLKYQQSMDRRKPYEPDYETTRGRDKEQRVWQPVSNSVVAVSPEQQERSQYIDRVKLEENRGNQLINSQRYQWDNYQQNNKANNYNSVGSIYRGENNPNNNIYELVGEQRQQQQQQEQQQKQQQQQQSHIFNHKGPGVIGEDSEGAAYVDQSRQYAPYYPPDRGLGWQEGENLRGVSKSPPDEERSRKPSSSSKSESSIVKSDVQRCKQNNEDDEDDKKSGKEKTFGVIKNVEKFNSVVKSDNEQSAAGVDGNVVSTIDGDDKKKKKKKKNKKISSTTDKKIDSTIDLNEKKITPDVNNNLESYGDEDDDENGKVRTEKPQIKHKEVKSSIVEHRVEDTTSGGFIVERMVYVSADERDFKPRGAVISLALGLTTTALMAALIACRLRVVRRRGRRGHGPYAHDADYLVNGMYL